MRIQVSPGISQDNAHGIQSIGATSERDVRLSAVFCRKFFHHRRSHVWWIGDNEIVASALQC
jgi:hypothetical protein